MALTRKHFEQIAFEIKAEVTSLEQNPLTTPQAASGAKVALRNVATNLCTFFREENPNFDRERFLKACGF